MKNIGQFLRAFEEKRLHMKMENDIVKDRITRDKDLFSIKAFLIQVFIGLVGGLTLVYLEPLVLKFSQSGGNSPVVFWGYIIGGILVIIGFFGVFDLIKKLLRL